MSVHSYLGQLCLYGADSLAVATPLFIVQLSAYCCQQSVTRDVPTENTPKKKKFNTPKKKFFSSLKGGPHIGMQSPGGPRAVRSTNFHEIACLPITVHALNKAHFALDRVGYSEETYQAEIFQCAFSLIAMMETKMWQSNEFR